MRQQGMRIGVLATRTGISVRTLHHYDQIGLLTPTARTAAAHRRYSAQDIARLQQIQSLRRLGFSLQEIKACLSDPAFPPQQVVALHLQSLRDQEAQLQGLIHRLERLAHSMANAREVSTDEFLDIVEVMTKTEQYVTPELKAEVAAREARLGQERIQAVGAEWSQLLVDLGAAMEAGSDPASPRVQEMAQRIAALVKEFTDGYPAITALAHAVHDDPELREQAGSSPAQSEYLHSLIAGSPGAPDHTGISPALQEYLHRVITAAGAGVLH